MEELLDKVSAALMNSLWLAPIFAFIGGVLTSLMPCSLSTVPLVIGCVGGGETKGRKAVVMFGQIRTTLPVEMLEPATADKKIQTVDELILAMRKCKGPNTEGELAHIALNMEDEALPRIVELFYRNRTAEFLEKAELILYYADRKYLDELFQNYDKIQSPYAQSMICFLIGKAEYENVDDFLLRQYQFMKRHYPSEHYHEFPLFALYILHPDLAYEDADHKKSKKHKRRRKR